MEKKQIEASEVFMETVSLKLDQQDQKIDNQSKKIAALENKWNEAPSWLFEIKADIQSLHAEVENRQVPADRIQELSNRLNAALPLLSQPMNSRVTHQHQLSVGSWVAVGLFLLLCLALSAWYVTAQKAAVYQGSDIKFRYLKLAADPVRSDYLYQLDSLYRLDPDSFANVVADQERAMEEHVRLLVRMDTLDRKINHWKANNSPTIRSK